MFINDEPDVAAATGSGVTERAECSGVCARGCGVLEPEPAGAPYSS
jgi:hypothetical protein